MIERILSPAELEAVRRKFGATLKRGQVIRLLRLFGYCNGKARDCIEGEDALLKPLPGFKPKRWHRETIIEELNLPIAA